MVAPHIGVNYNVRGTTAGLPLSGKRSGKWEKSGKFWEKSGNFENFRGVREFRKKVREFGQKS